MDLFWNPVTIDQLDPAFFCWFFKWGYFIISPTPKV